LSEYLKKLVEDRQSAYHAAKAKMDEAAAESRDLSTEEREFVDRTFAELDDKRAMIDTLITAEKREAEITEAMRGVENIARPVEARGNVQSDADVIRSLLTGERRSATFEVRDITKSSTSAPVPTTFASQVLDQMRYSGPMLDPSIVTIINTSGGEDLVLPTIASWSTAAITAEAAAISESDPVFGSTTLKSFKYSFLIQVSREMIEDSQVDVLGFLTRQAGNEFGFRLNNALTTGTGTVQPNGVSTAAAAGVTGGTGVSGAFTADNVISLVYSLDRGARLLPSFGVMANATSIAAMRSLKASTSGEYLFTPTLDAATPDRVLGVPLIENPHVASPATSAKSLLAGAFESYTVRSAGGLQVARSDEFAFSADLVTLRFTWRIDGNLPQTSHIKRFVGGAS
jgi:HK97 family phage major capsid protein